MKILDKSKFVVLAGDFNVSLNRGTETFYTTGEKHMKDAFQKMLEDTNMQILNLANDIIEPTHIDPRQGVQPKCIDIVLVSQALLSHCKFSIKPVKHNGHQL